MSISHEIDLDRRSFLNECDVVFQIPGTFNLEEESILKWEQEVICASVFSYIGIKENNGEFEFEEKYLNILSFTVEQDDFKGLTKQIDNDAKNGIKNRFLALEKNSYIQNLNINKSTFERFKKCKIKIWSEIPPGSYIRKWDCSFVALYFFCIENKIPFEKLNREIETYKKLLRRLELKIDILNIHHAKSISLTEAEEKACKIIMRLFEYLVLFESALDLKVDFSSFCPLLGPIFLNNQSSKYNISEAMIFHLPISEKKEYFSPFVWQWKNDDYLNYVNKLVNDKKLRIGLKENPLEYSEIIIAYWEQSANLFGPIFKDLFSENMLKFDIKTKPEVERFVIGLNENIEKSIKIHYRPPYLILIGPKDYISRAAKEIIESESGSIHFNSAIQTSSGSYGTRFLKKDEFKLPEGFDYKPESEKIRDGSSKISEQAIIIEKKSQIIFTTTKIHFSETEILNKDYPFIILEFIILEKRIHWLWGFVLFGSWVNIIEKHPKAQFGNYFSKINKKIREYGFHIEHIRGGDEWEINLDKTRNHIHCNLLEANDDYIDAIAEFEKGNIEAAFEKLISAIHPPEYKSIKYISAYKLLITCIFQLSYEKISESLLNEVANFLRWYKSRLEIAVFSIKHIYISNNLFSESEVEYKLKELENELNSIKSSYKAICNKVVISENDQAYEELLEFILNLKMLVEEAGEPDETMKEIIFESKVFIRLKNNKIIKKLFENKTAELQSLSAYVRDREETENYFLYSILKKGINLDVCNNLFSLNRYLKNRLSYKIDNFKKI